MSNDRTASDRTADWMMIGSDYVHLNDLWAVSFYFNGNTVYECHLTLIDDVLDAVAAWQNDGVLPD